jgi:hypothetical protein
MYRLPEKRDLWPPLSLYHEMMPTENIGKTEEQPDLICNGIWSPLPGNYGMKHQRERDLEEKFPVLETAHERPSLSEDDPPARQRDNNKLLYQDLPHSDSIRLLQIKPGYGDNPLVCSLQLARIDSLSVTYV